VGKWQQRAGEHFKQKKTGGVESLQTGRKKGGSECSGGCSYTEFLSLKIEAPVRKDVEGETKLLRSTREPEEVWERIAMKKGAGKGAGESKILYIDNKQPRKKENKRTETPTRE